jgi:uncharacterized protein (DUF3084 family)
MAKYVFWRKIMSVEDQIAGILTIISAQNEQIKANSEQIIANGEQIKSNSDLIKANGEQIKANSEQIIANGEQIKSNSDLIKANGEQIKANSEQIIANGEQIKVLTENMEFMEHVQYDFHLQMVTYQRDMRALRRDTLNLLKTLQQNRIL